MKKFNLFLTVFFLFACAPWATADDVPFIAFTTTGADESVSLKDTFFPDEIPYLFVQFPSSAEGTKTIMTTWTWSGDASFSRERFGPTDPQDAQGLNYWLYLPDWNSRTVAEKLGTWTITGEGGDFSNNVFKGLTTFTVVPVPEPVSSALFLMGGALLVPFLKRKKR